MFFRKAVPGFAQYLAIGVNVLALSVLVFVVISLAPKMPAWIRRLLPVLAIMMAAVSLSFLRYHLAHFVPSGHLPVLLALLLAFVLGLSLLFPSAAVRLLKGAALAATPCLAVTFIGPLFYIGGPSPLAEDPPLAHRQPKTPPVRVLWVVFDEWDQRLSFTDRKPGTLLPAIDDLAGRSFTASRALAVQSGMGIPVNHMGTAEAIPSLLYGRRVANFANDGGPIPHLAFDDGELTLFGADPNIFSRVLAHGWNAAAAGWYVPYCRVFGAQLTDCFWDEMYNQAASARRSLGGAAIDETRMLFETEQFSPLGCSLVDERHFEEYQTILAAARRYAADPSIGFAFIHFNVPHQPFICNPALGRFGPSGNPEDRYMDDLKWLDRAVKEILSAVSTAGLDGRTAVILSSDHPARFATRTDPHVPFIVHLPGYEAGTASDQELSTLGTADLVMSIAEGGTSSPSDVESLLLHAK